MPVDTDRRRICELMKVDNGRTSQFQTSTKLLSIAAVDLHVFLNVRQMTELFGANITAVLLLASVPPHMRLKVVESSVTGTAQVTRINFGILFRLLVVFHVSLKIAGNIFKANRTLLTHIVRCQFLLLSHMDFGMPLQVGLSAERFVA